MRLLAFFQSVFEYFASDKFKLSASRIYILFFCVILIWLVLIHYSIWYEFTSKGIFIMAFGNELGIQSFILGLVEYALNKIYGMNSIVKLLITSINYLIIYIFYSIIYFKIIKMLKGNTVFDLFSKLYLLVESLSFLMSTFIFGVMISYFDSAHISNPYEYIMSNRLAAFFLLLVYSLYWIFVSLCHISMLKTITDLSYKKAMIGYSIVVLPEIVLLLSIIHVYALIGGL